MDHFLGTSIQYAEAQIKLLEKEHALQIEQTVKRLIDSGFLDSDYDSYDSDFDSYADDCIDIAITNNNVCNLQTSDILVCTNTQNAENIIETSAGNTQKMGITVISEKYDGYTMETYDNNEFKQSHKFRYYYQEIICILMMIAIMYCASTVNTINN
eukprot:UN02015